MATSPAPALDTTATLTYNDTPLNLPLVRGTEGETAIDIQKLRAATGLITLDPGFGNTGACRSAITFIDGEQGILRYRGYDIAELAEKSTFLEVAWLLLYGELPTESELAGLTGEVTRHTMLHENFRRFFEALPKDAHPMPVCAAAVAALATFYQGAEKNGASLRETVVRLIAKMPTIAAYSYKHSIGQPFVYPINRLSYAANFLHMMFATPCDDFEVDPVIARALDLLLILHADHEQNCSTSTVRVVGSSKANLFASVSAGIAALWGPLHGGANQQVIEMLESHRGRGRRRAEVRRSREGQEGQQPADGLRPSRLQELRPARGDSPQVVHRRAASGSASRAGSSRSRCSSRTSRSRTSTSSATSCTRTSTSTRGSSTRRSAFR